MKIANFNFAISSAIQASHYEETIGSKEIMLCKEL